MYICEYDHSIAPTDRSYIESMAKSYHSDYQEIEPKHYSECWKTYLKQIGLDDSYLYTGNLVQFILNDITYFCIVINPGLNAEQWLYGKITITNLLY